MSAEGKLAFEEILSGGALPSALDTILGQRVCADTDLFKIAQALHPEAPRSVYEGFGGEYVVSTVKLGEAVKGGLKAEVSLFPHQKDAVEKIITKGGNLLLSHPVGSGKTLTAIAAFEEMRKRGMAGRALVVAPASLRTNFVENGIKKFTYSKGAIFGNAQEAAAGSHVSAEHPDKSAQYHVVSYELFRVDPKKYIDAAGADTLIYDELHRMKNEGVLTSKAIKDARQYHKNFIGMTGSIVSNTPADIVPLVDAMTDGKHLLGNKTTFESRFVKTDDDTGKKSLRNPMVVRSLLGPYVHHVDPEELNTKAPKKVIEEVRVDMSPEQTQLYRFIINKLDPVTKLRLKAGVSKLNNMALNDMFAKMLRLRQISNSIHTMDTRVSAAESADKTPKIKQVLDDVEEHLRETPDGQVVLHTNMIHGGVDVLTEGLKKRGIEPAIFIGKGNPGVTEKFRQQGVKEFQEGKKKVIVLSAAGGEGLDLPNTTFMGMVDGHFNPEKINQAEARGVRAGGQAHRPESQRRVIVRRYVSVLPNDLGDKVSVLANIWDNLSPKQVKARLDAGAAPFYNPFKKDPSSDEWVYAVASRKGGLNKALHETIKTSSAVALPTTHEQLEEMLIEKTARLTDHLGDAAWHTGKFLRKHPAGAGAVLGGAYGALMGGTAPRSKREAEQDPNATVRNRLSSIAGGAAAGALSAYTAKKLLQDNGDPAVAYNTLLNFGIGPFMGRNVADLFAPKRTVPVSVQRILGEDKKTYSDKALFEKYWNTFGKELEDKGIKGAVSDAETEAKFITALRDLYQESATVKPTLNEQAARMNASGKMGPKPSKLRFALTTALPQMVLGPAAVGASTAMMADLQNDAKRWATRRAVLEGIQQMAPGIDEVAARAMADQILSAKDKGNDALKSMGIPVPEKLSPARLGLLSAVPLFVGSAANVAKTYRDMYVDPGVETVTSKADTRKRAKFSDDQIRQLLRGLSVDELKVKSHYIK
jgi:superfamily II DNA or RNA helicase